MKVRAPILSFVEADITVGQVHRYLLRSGWTRRADGAFSTWWTRGDIIIEIPSNGADWADFTQLRVAHLAAGEHREPGDVLRDIAKEESDALWAAWERVYRAHAPISEFVAAWWMLVREGHPNRFLMLESDLDDVSGCVYRNDGPCSNEGEPCHVDFENDPPSEEDEPEELNVCPYDTPERAEKRESLRALLALLRQP